MAKLTYCLYKRSSKQKRKDRIQYRTQFCEIFESLESLWLRNTAAYLQDWRLLVMNKTRVINIESPLQAHGNESRTNLEAGCD